MSRRRQTIARRLVEAQQTAAMLTTFNEVDMSAVMDAAQAAQGRIPGAPRHQPRLHVVLHQGRGRRAQSVPAAERRDPGRRDRHEAVLRHRHRRRRPTKAWWCRSCATRTARASPRSSGTSRSWPRRAREGTLTLAELQGGTFTITNGGVFGSLLSTPILNTPQVGILGMHTIQERPVVVGRRRSSIRPMMYLALSYDHRIVDGSEAVRFLVRIKELVQDPESLLLEG